MKKMFFCLFVSLVAVSVYAVTSEEVSKAVESAVLEARLAQTQNEYKGFNPHLTPEQMQEIPTFVDGVLKRLQEAGYKHLTSNDVVKGLFMHMEISCGLLFPSHYTARVLNEEGQMEELTIKKELSWKGWREKHALSYAFAKVFGPSCCAYNNEKYPPVEDWKAFHFQCQRNMEEIYALLKKLQTCEWHDFTYIMGNLM